MYPESHDQFTVPGGGPNPLYGVEVHAHAIANLLPGSFPAEAGLAWWLVAAAAAALAAAVAIAFLPFVPALLVLGALLVGIAVAVPLAWQSAGLILPAVFAGIPIVASVPVLAFIHVFVENRERRRLKGYFSRYVAPSVVEHLLNQAAAPRLGGERRHVAVLFSDIAGFTTMSEQMEPEEIVELLNRYFTRMVDQVFAQEGTINKFIGDAIMALFGAPVGQDDCELRAVKTALAMRQALADFNCEQTASGGRQIKAGIGLHAGPVVVGNIGSERQMEYTVIGDTVNLCSRLEGLSRGFDADIIISDAVYRKVQAFVEVWSPEPVQVKGKQEPVQVHVLIGLK
jgi:adenylate cyclase